MEKPSDIDRQTQPANRPDLDRQIQMEQSSDLDRQTHAEGAFTSELPRVWTHPWHNHAHHRPEGGFENVWPGSIDAHGASFWKGVGWFLRSQIRRKKNRPAPARALSPSDLARPPSTLRITWLGHSAVLIQRPDVAVLVDPMLGPRASPVRYAGPRRHVSPPIRPDALPRLDLVLLSHNHYDHLDESTIRQIVRRQDPLFLVPLGCGQYLRQWGARRVVETDWWQYVEIASLRIHCTPAKHFSGRGLGDRDETLWAGWYLEDLSAAGSGRQNEGMRGSKTDRKDEGLRGTESNPLGTETDPPPAGTQPSDVPNASSRSHGRLMGDVFYAGDTAYAEHFRTIRERIGAPEVVILPIGAYRPRWLMGPVHVTPEEAFQAFVDLEAEHFVPVHWGTFDLADEPIQEPPGRLLRAAEEHGAADRIRILEVGESWSPMRT